MPIQRIQGLRGLPGLNRLSEEDRNAFISSNATLNSLNIRRPGLKRKAAEMIFNNNQFINKFGQDRFNELNNGSIEAYNARNELLKTTIANEEFAKAFSPWSDYFHNKGKRNNNRGLGSMWEQYEEMSPDAKIKLLESDWQTPTEFNKRVEGQQKAIDNAHNHPFVFGAGAYQNLGETSWESYYQTEKEKNDKLLNQIYNDDLISRTQKLSGIVSQVYAQDNSSDDAVKKRFYDTFVSNDSPMVKMHKGQYAAHINSDEMKNFSIDDMRKALAKWDTYTKYMSPYAAGTAINNEAQEYIANHQSGWKKADGYLRDFGISTLSYMADKVNGFVNVGYGLADINDGGVNVYLDKDNNILDPKDTIERNGKIYYTDSDGKLQSVRGRKMARTTLRNMGKNLDGSDNHGFLWDGDPVTLNPQYWSRAEQYGTLNEDEQKQLEQYGSSPHTVAYKPNEDGSFWWEVFKMGTFGLADMATALIPVGGGIGLAGKGFNALSKAGKTTNYFNRAMNGAGRFLMNNSQRIAQLSQGTAGALGIAYAYNRGAFQETLEKNLGDAEEALKTRANSTVINRYNTDKEYKSYVDRLVNARAAKLKKDYLNQINSSDGGMKIADMRAVDKYVRSQAEAQVQQEEEDRVVKQIKDSPEYAQLQNRAIDEAGDAAFNTFWPEAIKYGLVNTVGFRKWLYTNPTGLKTKVSSALKGLKEITTDGGKQRLATEASKFLTRGDKWKQFGKTAGGQMWGGAWTNGTDDMMTDAAERMSSDSYDRYINDFLDGEAVADTYGMADGIYTFMKNADSYIKGLSNSMGQETTWNATKVGALGSVFSGNLNFVNLGRLATKSGREAYRKTFQERYQRDDNGIIKKDEKGNPLTEKTGWKENWRDRAAYFIQNGILNTYYGKKQAEKDLQSHADFVNNLLNDADDFEDIKNLLASDNGLEDAVGTNDLKTMRFIKALKTAKTLSSLGNNSSDPARMSSVVQNAKALMDAASQIDFDAERDNVPDDDLSRRLISEYYAVNNNAGNPHNAFTDRKALATVIKNSKDFQEASQAYDAAEKELQKAERASNKTFSPIVRERLKLNHALNGHWQHRLDTMKDEIGDTSEAGELSEDNVIPSLGSKENAQDLVKVYNRQEKEVTSAINKQTVTTEEAKKKYDEAVKELSDNKDDNLTFELQQKVVDAKSEYDNQALQEGYLKEVLATTKTKRRNVENALKATEEEGYKGKVLMADEIMALDPVSRARMLYNDDTSITDEERKKGIKSWRERMYSPEQIAEIEKLERQLTMRDADALQKVQDIAVLTQRIETNKDAYSRVLQNPEAAAQMFEAQRNAAAERGYSIINQRNAQMVANIINDADNSTRGYKDLTKEQKETSVYHTLRQLNPSILNIIDSDNLLPQYHKQVADAKEWQKVVEDLDAVIFRADKDDTWKENVSKYVNAAERVSNNREELFTNLEMSIDNSSNSEAVRSNLDYVLQSMENLGYHRNATTLENRAKRKEREEKERAEAADREAKEKALKDKVKKAAEDEAVEAAKKAAAKEAEENAQPEVPVAPNGSNIAPTAEVDEDKQAEDAEKAGEGEEADLGISNDDVLANTFGNGSVISTRKRAGNQAIDTYTKVFKDDDGTIHIKAQERHADNKEDIISLAYAPIPEGWKIPQEAIEAFDDPNPQVMGFNEVRIKDGKVSAKVAIKGDDHTLTTITVNLEPVQDNSKNFTDDGDTVGSRNETLDEQIKDGEKQGLTQYSSNENVDSEKVNDTIEATMENRANTLSGNAMSEYDPTKLEENGVMAHKQGASANDSMNKFYAWMKNAGIHLQNIIDTELFKILAANPHAKVRFMSVKPSHNATKDIDVQSHLFLVLDYDDNINRGITKAHNNENGGVIASNGKQYLIVGVAGYGNKRNTDKLALYDILFSNNPHSKNGYGLALRERKKYFDEHPDDRYYVLENVETEIVPNSLIPGYIVRQLESDSNAEYRDISKVLADKDRNSDGLALKDLAWGIQELRQFMTVFPKGVEERGVMVPQNSNANMGRAFVLIPASNGLMVPSYLRPLFYADVEENGSVMREGRLKDEVYGHLNELASMDYQTRLNGIIGLSKIFHFDNKNGNGILTTKPESKASVISFLHNGQVFKSFNLDAPNFTRQDVFDAFKLMNPRVNITASVLRSPERLEVYDEAGALQTDAALLHTVGSSYSIYAVDANGNMLGQSKTPENTVQTSPVNSDFRKDSRQVVFKHNLYTYTDGNYYLNGREITDTNEIRQLDYNRRIFVENELEPSVSQGIWNTFILSKGEHPEVVRVNKNTYEVKEVPEAEAKALIDNLDKKNSDKERKNAAEEAIQIGKGKEVELGLDNAASSIEQNLSSESTQTATGEQPTEKQPIQEEEQEFDPETGEVYDKFNPRPTAIAQQAPVSPTPPKAEKKATQTFNELMNNSKYSMMITMALMRKWKDAPKDEDKLMDYLRKKNIEVDAIGTSDADIEAWIKTVQDCR